MRAAFGGGFCVCAAEEDAFPARQEGIAARAAPVWLLFWAHALRAAPAIALCGKMVWIFIITFFWRQDNFSKNKKALCQKTARGFGARAAG